MMKIIPINLSKDLSAIKKVVNKAFSKTPDSNISDWYSFEELKNSIQKRTGICLKAIENNKIIGVIHAMQENPINGKEGVEKWVITNIAVIPEKASQGTGGKLLKEIEKVAKEKKVKKIFTHTNKGDIRVINFYKKHGYQNAGWIKDYYYDGSAIFLLKHL